MSSHRAAIEMIAEKVEEIRAELDTATQLANSAKENWNRRVKEVELLTHQLKAWEDSLSTLVHDANVSHVQVYPS